MPKRLYINFYNTEYKYLYSTINFNPDTTISTKDQFRGPGYGASLSVRYEKFKPINLYWQQDFSTEILTGIWNVNSENVFTGSSYTDDMMTFGVTGKYNLRYYPNSRSTYTGEAGFNFYDETGQREISLVKSNLKHINLNLKLDLRAEYDFSPQLTVKGSVGLNYYNYLNSEENGPINHFQKNNSVSLSLNMGLYYKLF